ncbi:hypothetical protein KR009_006822 [Drosophila setifemur]|nr:hypothetical protein KR009_006822 [Drosophila setifemur]
MSGQTSQVECREAPESRMVLQAGAMSRTHQYRKVMKPLLERKRRARINRCLDELKHLIKEMAYMDADALAKMEKADILELTVHHLRRQHIPDGHTQTYSFSYPNQRTPAQMHRLAIERYWSGFRQCVLEVSRFLQRQDRSMSSRFLEAMEQFLPAQPQLWRPWYP